MTTFKNLQDQVLLKLYGYGLRQPRATFLTQIAYPEDTTLYVASVEDLEMGIAEIGGELIFIESVDTSANTVTVSPDGRGYYGTEAVEHAKNSRLTFAPVWPRQQVKDALNEVILSVYPTLFGVAQHQFTFNPAVTTYSLPADAEGVLRVTADVNGPSLEQQHIHRYGFNSVAPTDDWVTTNSITLQEAVTPGRTVTVTYSKQPSELSADADTLTDSGLRESARRVLVYGACAELATFMDAARLAVDTTMADELDDRNQLGLSTRIANQLQVRYELELEREAARLRQTTPVPVNVRIR